MNDRVIIQENCGYGWMNHSIATKKIADSYMDYLRRCNGHLYRIKPNDRQ